ncbi:MAG: P-loop NTPase [Microthrixaceae bacterium]|nr:P-loop NTPase [Microthrixaceae bacterium]
MDTNRNAHDPADADQRSASAPAPTEDHVLGILGAVMDPELGSDIVSLGMVRGVDVKASGAVRIGVALTTAGCPLRGEIQRDVRARVGGLPGVTSVKIDWGELTAEEKASTMQRARKAVSERPETTTVPMSTKVLLVASGKGGVGKSSVSVNLAAALAAQGRRVGVLDADIWGFSVPRMLGVSGRLEADDEGRMLPQVVARRLRFDRGGLDGTAGGAGGQRADVARPDPQPSGAPLPRGRVVGRPRLPAGRHAPGHRRRADGARQDAPTRRDAGRHHPSLAAQLVAVRVVDMGRKNFLHVTGVIENMSAYVDAEGRRHEIFGSGGGNASPRKRVYRCWRGFPSNRELPTEGTRANRPRWVTGPQR